MFLRTEGSIITLFIRVGMSVLKSAKYWFLTHQIKVKHLFSPFFPLQVSTMSVVWKVLSTITIPQCFLRRSCKIHFFHLVPFNRMSLFIFMSRFVALMAIIAFNNAPRTISITVHYPQRDIDIRELLFLWDKHDDVILKHQKTSSFFSKALKRFFFSFVSRLKEKRKAKSPFILAPIDMGRRRPLPLWSHNPVWVSARTNEVGSRTGKYRARCRRSTHLRYMSAVKSLELIISGFFFLLNFSDWFWLEQKN